jgi:hypothetical protein
MPGSSSRRPSRRTLLVYLAAWLAVGAIVVLVAVALLDGGSSADGTLPPVRQTALESAAHAAGCRLERRRPSDDARAAAAAGGSYAKAPSVDALQAALRRGTVVLSYRPGLPEELLSKLQAIQRTIPRATILTPGTRRMQDAVAMSAYRRLLVCPRVSAEGLDALRLFQGRYLGSGPGR